MPAPLSVPPHDPSDTHTHTPAFTLPCTSHHTNLLAPHSLPTTRTLPLHLLVTTPLPPASQASEELSPSILESLGLGCLQLSQQQPPLSKGAELLAAAEAEGLVLTR